MFTLRSNRLIRYEYSIRSFLSNQAFTYYIFYNTIKMNSFSAEEIVEKPAWDNVKICLNRRIPCGRHYTYVATQKWLDCKLNFIYENDGANGSQYSMMIRTVEPLFKNLGFSMKIKTIPVTSFIMLHSVGDLKIEFHAHAEGAEKNDFTMQVSSLKKLVNVFYKIKKRLPSFKYFQSETNHLYLMNHDLCHPLQLYARRTRPVSAPTPALPSIQAIPLLRPRRTLKAPEPEPEPDPESNLFFFLEEDHEEIQPIGIFCRMFNCFGNCFNDNLIN